jgi:hypothetical protein
MEFNGSWLMMAALLVYTCTIINKAGWIPPSWQEREFTVAQ